MSKPNKRMFIVSWKQDDEDEACLKIHVCNIDPASEANRSLKALYIDGRPGCLLLAKIAKMTNQTMGSGQVSFLEWQAIQSLIIKSSYVSLSTLSQKDW